jgi:hypothetical protein
MPCIFEELLEVKNVLNFQDVQTIVIKAKVSRAEPFYISIVQDEMEASSSPNGFHIQERQLV